jgi:hypothetical protein
MGTGKNNRLFQDFHIFYSTLKKEVLLDMRAEIKVNAYNTLFVSVLFGVAFTMIGGLITNGSIDWHNFLIEVIFSIVVGFIVGMVIPGGKFGSALADKVAKPGTLFFNLIMYTVLILIMLLFMCPILTLFIGCIIMGASIISVLPNLFSLYIPFFIIAVLILTLFGDYLIKLSMKCAGVPMSPAKKGFPKQHTGK